jgi:quercetin 2,3-dioxygenase
MINVRRSNERGHASHGWLDTWHTFSFAGYFDPEQMGFHGLRVINEDRVAPGRGFGKHPHNDMEIVTYVVSGELAHRDSMGNGSTLHAGDVQAMSAGSGITHSEFNASQTDPVHLLQIWIEPERENVRPSYGEKHFSREEKLNKLVPIAGAEAALKLNQQATIYATVLEAGKSLAHKLGEERHAWVQVVSGEITVNGQTLQAGDGAAISGEPVVELTARNDAELLLFDLS